MGSRKKTPDGFVVFGKTLESLCLLPEESAGRVVHAAARLFLDGSEPEGLELSEQIVFALLRADIEASLEHHAAICRRNQDIANRRTVTSRHQPSPIATSRDEPLPAAPNRNESEPSRTELNQKESESKKRGADKSPRAARFTPPSFEEVSAYCAERRNGVDARRFVDFYTSKGWKVGKDAMRDWKAAVRTWERRDQPGSIRTAERYTFCGEESL